MLSNTATPKYYSAFRDKVISGQIPVCREISLEMNRIDELIRNPKYYYDEAAVEGYIAFAEAELCLTDGSPLVLMDSFKLWAEQLFGWWYFVEKNEFVPGKGKRPGKFYKRLVKKRLVKKQFLIVARGAAKTMYGMTIHAFFLAVDMSSKHQITVAPTMRQADEIMSPLRTAILRSRGPLFSFLTNGKSIHSTKLNDSLKAQLVSTKKGIENFLTGSLLEVRPMSITKLQGLRPRIATVDEWLSGDIREDTIGAIEQGATKLDDYIILAISSEGTIRNGAGDTMKMELREILEGNYYAPQVSIFHYRLDDIKEIGNPELWVKAQPNIGITVSFDAYQSDVERAEKAPANRNDIIAKRFGIPMEGFTYFFTYEETLPSSPFECDGRPCSLGMDLSQGDDFCAFTFLFPTKTDLFLVKNRCYITSLTLDTLPLASRIKYQSFIDEGSLVVIEGSVILDMMSVYDDLDRFILEHEYDVRCLGYDPYNSREFLSRWTAENSEYGIEKVIQGSKTETVPLGELKTLAEEGLLKFDSLLFSYAMGNTMVLVDTNGNRKLYKNRYDAKIDPVSALMDAYVAFKLNRTNF